MALTCIYCTAAYCRRVHPLLHLNAVSHSKVMYRQPRRSVDQSQWQRSWLTSPVWVISLWQPAALWWLLPSQEHASHTCQSASPPPTPFPLKVNTTVSPHYTYVLTDTLKRHACTPSTCAHTQRTFTDTVHIMVTNPAWAGSHLWVTAWCVVRVKLPRHLPFADGSVGCPRALSGGHGCRIRSTYIFPRLWGWRGKLSHKGGVRLIITP